MDDLSGLANLAGESVVSGGALVADFQTAIANLVAMETANYAAEQSERTAIQTIQGVGPGTNGLYITPKDIPGAVQQTVLRSSIDAHIKKVQAQQIATYTVGQINQMEADDIKKYCGRKVLVEAVDKENGAIESYWYDNKTGRESRGVVKIRNIKGTVEELSFSKNLIVIKPLFAARVLLSTRKFFLVSIINPETLAPLVEIRLI